jgi:hypothetical protein
VDYFVGLGGNGSTASRDLGGIPCNSSYPGSISLRNRMFISEVDARTFKSVPDPRGFALCGWASNETAYIAMTKRESGYMLSQGHGTYWFDMTGGWFSTNTLMQVTDGGMAGIQKAFTRDLQNPGRPYAELAVFLDEESALYIDPDFRRNWLVNMFQKQMDALNGSGVPYHFYLQKDLTNSALPDYKAYIFLNAYKISAAEKAKIASLKTAGKKLCFMHAPNIIGTNNPSGGIQAITGIAVTNNSNSQLLMVLPTNGYSTVFGGTVDSLSGNVFTGPGYKVTDAGATKIGVYADQQSVMAAAVKGNVVFCGSPDMTAGFVNDFAKWAGLWVASEPGDGVFINQYWLTIHAVTDGEKTITLATPSRVVDFTTGKEIAKKTQTVVVSMKRGETRWFALTPRK